MSDHTTNLALSFIGGGQIHKHVSMNEALLKLDALVQPGVASATLSAQPASPADGAVYILPSGATGEDWGAFAAHCLAHRDGVWDEITPREGFSVWVRDTDTMAVFDGAAWVRSGAAFTRALAALSSDGLVVRGAGGRADASGWRGDQRQQRRWRQRQPHHQLGRGRGSHQFGLYASE